MCVFFFPLPFFRNAMRFFLIRGIDDSTEAFDASVAFPYDRLRTSISFFFPKGALGFHFRKKNKYSHRGPHNRHHKRLGMALWKKLVID